MAELNEIYKSVLEADRAAVVICDLEHNGVAKSFWARVF